MTVQSAPEVVDFVPSAKVTKLEVPTCVRNYFLAKNIVHSAVGFAVFNATFFMLWRGYTALALLFYAIDLTLVVSILILTVMTLLHKFNAGPPPPTHSLPFQIDQEAVGKIAQGIVVHINCFLRSFNEWRNCVNPAHSVLAVVGFLIVAKIAQCITISCAAYIAGLIVFIAPPVYQANQTVIDQHLAKAKTQVSQLYAQIYDKLPPQLRQAAGAAKAD